VEVHRAMHLTELLPPPSSTMDTEPPPSTTDVEVPPPPIPLDPSSNPLMLVVVGAVEAADGHMSVGVHEVWFQSC
jgi:hypothetical protein